MNNNAPQIHQGIFECNRCPGQVFFSQQQLADHLRTSHPQAQIVEAAKNAMPSQSQAPVKKLPVRLTYKYEGNCDCGSNVETLFVEVDGSKKSHVCIAWCPGCKKQLQTRSVPKL